MSRTSAYQQFFVPSTDVVTQIIIPTIAFCIGMVVAMLIGINKCKQWELDKVMEIRLNRRIIQRLTARMRERNFKAIQKARDIRIKRAALAAKAQQQKALGQQNGGEGSLAQCQQQRPAVAAAPPPPIYGGGAVSQQQPQLTHRIATGRSPPPSYEDSLLDQLYRECIS